MNRVQILNEAVCSAHIDDTIRKDMPPIILTTAIGK